MSEVSESTVDTIIRTNKLVYATQTRKDHKIIIHSFPENVELGLFTWSDAAGQNRRDGSSTQGLFLGMSPVGLLEGNMEKVTPIAWHANKIDRVVRKAQEQQRQLRQSMVKTCCTILDFNGGRFLGLEPISLKKMKRRTELLVR